MLRPEREMEILRQTTVIQARAIEILNTAICRLDGDIHQSAWCRAINLALSEVSEMKLAERAAYSHRRRCLYEEWLNKAIAHDLSDEEKAS
ncbi:MAG: hypothetical protein HC799_16235 [Limnothrix sp. RL_2_0]|nr:hypothetical protein [Limnothrix sp. RL_2_0]